MEIECEWTARRRERRESYARQFVEKLRYNPGNPVKRGLVAEPELWRWSSYRSYAFGEEGMVRINQLGAAILKVRAHAA